MVVFQALTWEPRDTEDEHHVSIFGKTEDGKSVCVTTAFNPYFFIKLSFGTSQQTINEIYNLICRKCPECVISYSMAKSKDVWGFQNNEEFFFMKINFTNLGARRRVDGFLRKPVQLSSGSRVLKVYESNLDPTRFCVSS